MLPALVAAGVLVMIGGIAAMIAVATLVVGGVVAFGITVLRAFGLGESKRRLTFEADKTIEGADKTIEGIVVNRSSSDG